MIQKQPRIKVEKRLYSINRYNDKRRAYQRLVVVDRGKC